MQSRIYHCQSVNQ